MARRPVLHRPPPRRPAELMKTTPAQQLPPPRSPWPLAAAVCTAAGLAGFGAAPLLGYPGLAQFGLAAGLLTAATSALSGIRSSARRRLADRLVEAVAPGLGLRVPDRRAVKLHAWSWGWPGVPARVDLRYAPGVDDADPNWLADLATAVGRRLLADYKVQRHDRRRCRIRLRWVPPRLAATLPAVHARAERTILELLGPTAVVTGVDWSGEDLAALAVRHEAGTRVANAQYRHRVERVVSTMLPGRWRAGWELEDDRVRFEVRPALPKLVAHPAPATTAADGRYRLPMAVGEDGEVIAWNLRGLGPHLMVVGKTGSGKTVIILGIVIEACARGWPVWICDPKRVEFMGLRSWPNVQLVATTVEDQIATIYRAWEEMEARYALVESEHADEGDFEPLILVLDEYRDFVGAASEWYSRIKVRGMPSKCPVFEKVSSLARRGRTAQIHVVLGTQRPDAEFLTGEMRDNFATRISLGRLSPQGAMMMWEAAYIGVSVPRGIPGRGTVVTDDDRPVEVQGYWTPDPRRAARANVPADLAILDHLRPSELKHPSLQVQMPEDLLHPRDAEPRLWEAVLSAQLVEALEPPPEPAQRPPAELLAGTPPADAAPPRSESSEVEVDDPVDVGSPPDEEDGYGPEEEVRVDRLTQGDLVLVEEATQLWAVVEDSEPDLDDAAVVCIDWRSDDDEFGSLAVPDDCLITARRPIDPAASNP